MFTVQHMAGTLMTVTCSNDTNMSIVGIINAYIMMCYMADVIADAVIR